MDENDGLLLNIISKPVERKLHEFKRSRFENKVDNGGTCRNAKKLRKIDQGGLKKNDGSMPIPRPNRDQNNSLDKNTFLSSLFTSNPSVTTLATDAEEAAAASTNAPLSDGDFESLGIASNLCDLLEKRFNFSHPTKIQRAGIPAILAAKQDVLMIAQTGSGKTLAYLLPLLTSLLRQPNLNRESGLFALILAPTRELAQQIYEVLTNLVHCCHWLVPGVVVGGEKRKSEKSRIRKGVNILVGTPGRLFDHLEHTSSLKLNEIRYVIMDEGDRLVDLGFEQTVSEILLQISEQSQLECSEYTNLPSCRKTVVCSATMSSSTKRLQNLALRDSIWIRETVDLTEITPAQLCQDVLVVPAKLRLVSLAAVLKSRAEPAKRAIVFCSCADSVDFHFKLLGKQDTDTFDDDKEEEVVLSLPSTRLAKNINLFRLHGNMSQAHRTGTMKQFLKANNESFGVLFCTDVASRGLDFKVDNVIEFDPPISIEDHIHRVGRTARAGSSGKAVMFLLPDLEEGYINLLKSAHPVAMRRLDYRQQLANAFGLRWEVTATTWHLDLERLLLKDDQLLQLARKAFLSFLRAYTTHPNAEKQYFNVKKLHLGHIAKSFCLREMPGHVCRKHQNQFMDQALHEEPSKTSHNKYAMLKAARKLSHGNEFNIF